MAQSGSNVPQFASLYVGDLHPDVTEAMLYEIFNSVGPVASIRVCRDSVTRKSLGYGYVNFHSVSDAERALDTLNYSSIKGRSCRIMWSQRDPSLRKSGAGNIYVKNLDRNIDNKALYDTFSLFGNILSCKVAADPTGRSYGYGFVHYETEEAAKQAIERVNGMQIGEKQVQVCIFVKRSEREKPDVTNYTNLYVKSFPAEWDEAKLEEERDTLTEEILQLENDLNEATENRNEDKANNKKTLTDAKEGKEALEQALTILKDFYRKAGRNKVLLEASPVGEDMAAEGVDGAQAGAYKGNQAAGAGIIAMLETIHSDFARTLKDTEAAEYKASRDFAAFSQETKASISSKSAGLKNTINELERTSSDLVAALNDLKDNQELLDKSLETLEKLRPACVDTGMTYEERVARREAEIEALKKAVCVLDEEDGEIAEIGRASCRERV